VGIPAGTPGECNPTKVKPITPGIVIIPDYAKNRTSNVLWQNDVHYGGREKSKKICQTRSQYPGITVRPQNIKVDPEILEQKKKMEV